MAEPPAPAPVVPRFTVLEGAARDRLNRLMWAALQKAEMQLVADFVALGLDLRTNQGVEYSSAARALFYDLLQGSRPQMSYRGGNYQGHSYAAYDPPTLEHYAKELSRALADKLVKDFRPDAPTPVEGSTGRSSHHAA